MATLHVRNVPSELYRRIQARAARERRSLSAEVVRLLEIATGYRPDADEIFDRIRRRRLELEKTVGTLPSSVDLIREDRER